MCRLIVYFGNEVSVKDAIVTHGHGLLSVAQAPVYTPWISKEIFYTKSDIVNHQENADGFGIGFYSSDRNLPVPAVLRGCKPIWHSNNLGPLVGAVKSPLVFGHVRKTRNYGSLAEQNCHPFCHGVYMFMHNGGVWKFHKVRVIILWHISKIFDSVSKDHDIESNIQGTTDSEAVFFLILALIAKLKNSLDFTKANCTAKELKSCTQEAINMILQAVNDKVGNEGPGSKLNFALTDGTQVIVTRFRNKRSPPPSLYYTLRQKDAKALDPDEGIDELSYLSSDDDSKEINKEENDKFMPLPRKMHLSHRLNFGFSGALVPQVVMIASEPMNPEEEEFWKLVPRNHVLSVEKDFAGNLKVKSEMMNIPESLFAVSRSY
jgi:predicted glutamine amidotransferase